MPREMRVTEVVTYLFEMTKKAAEVQTGLPCRWKYFHIEFSRDGYVTLCGSIYRDGQEVTVKYALCYYENEISFNLGEYSYDATFSGDVARVVVRHGDDYSIRPDGVPMVWCGKSYAERWQEPLFDGEAPRESVAS